MTVSETKNKHICTGMAIQKCMSLIEFKFPHLCGNIKGLSKTGKGCSSTGKERSKTGKDVLKQERML